MDNEVFYMYKNTMYDTPPIKSYEEYKVDIVGVHTLIYIRKVIPDIIHIIILTIFLCLLIIMNFIYGGIVKLCTNDHIIAIPDEIYYNKEYNILDLDFYNNRENKESVDIKILVGTDVIFEYYDLKQNSYIGSIKVDNILYELPVKATVYYTPHTDTIQYDTITIPITLFPRDYNVNIVNEMF